MVIQNYAPCYRWAAAAPFLSVPRLTAGLSARGLKVCARRCARSHRMSRWLVYGTCDVLLTPITKPTSWAWTGMPAGARTATAGGTCPGAMTAESVGWSGRFAEWDISSKRSFHEMVILWPGQIESSLRKIRNMIRRKGHSVKWPHGKIAKTTWTSCSMEGDYR